MHELAITKNIVDMVLNECRKRKVKNVEKVVIELGDLTSFKKEPIKFYFDILKKKNPLIKSSYLNFIEKKGKIKCKDCSRISLITDQTIILCPVCGSGNIRITQGKDIKIKEIFVGERNV
jgi:hydrogenase nickel incorporation protein HypA/HybF